MSLAYLFGNSQIVESSSDDGLLVENIKERSDKDCKCDVMNPQLCPNKNKIDEVGLQHKCICENMSPILCLYTPKNEKDITGKRYVLEQNTEDHECVCELRSWIKYCKSSKHDCICYYDLFDNNTSHFNSTCKSETHNVPCKCLDLGNDECKSKNHTCLCRDKYSCNVCLLECKDKDKDILVCNYKSENHECICDIDKSTCLTDKDNHNCICYIDNECNAINHIIPYILYGMFMRWITDLLYPKEHNKEEEEKEEETAELIEKEKEEETKKSD